MKNYSTKNPAQPMRRRVVATGGALTAAAIGAPWVARFAHAQAADLGPYQQAKINWRQAEGAEITVMVIPASYFDNLITIAPQFEALSGARSLRENATRSDSAKGDARSVVEDCDVRNFSDRSDVLPAVCREWVDPLDRYLGDAKLTDNAWFRYDDIFKAWRDADSLDGKPYGIPYDGEVTVQVYRKDLYDAKGLKAAETLDEFVKNAAAIHDPANRVYGMALRGFAGAGQNMYIYPSIFKEFGGEWMKGNRVVVNSPEAVRALDWYVDAESKYAPPACAIGTGPISPTRFHKARSALTSTRTRPLRC